MDTSKHLNRPLGVGGGITCAALLIAVALTSACGDIACEKTLTCAPDDSSSGGDGMGGEADSSEGSGAGTNGSSGGSGGDGDGDGDSGGTSGDGDGDGDSQLSCDDGLDCTDDLQTTDGQCVHVTQESFCVIDGGCVGDGEENPENSCQACVGEVSPSRWSAAKSEGESCDFCRECSADAQCEKADECCDVAAHPHNAFVCGLHVSEETLVEDGCGAGESSVVRSETHSSTSSTGYTCSAGTWNFSGHADSLVDGAYSPLAVVSLSFSDGGRCSQPPSLPERTCSSFCTFGRLPKEVRSGDCDTFAKSGGVESGAVVGIRTCDPGEETCEERTVTCEGNNWMAPTTASVSASPDSEAVLGDVWFAREGDEERELRAASCEARRCQLLDLGFYYRRCALVSAANDSVEVGDEVRYFFSTRGPDINQSGRSANYQCQLDGSWIQTDDSVGGGSNCPDCAHELIDRWYINDVIVQENICTDACYVDDAPNYNYQELVGFGSLQPAGSSYTRCVYEAGVLVSADIAACSTESDNEWTSYGEDSSCPETVEDLNALATVYTNVTPCSTDNCVAWRSSWGWWTKTAEIPD